MTSISGKLDSTYEYQTKIFCIISDQRVFRSKSPEMFGGVFQRAGIRGAYVPFMIDHDDLGKAMESLRVLNIAGANITAPFKESVIPYLDVLSEGANIIGAVNTIVCKPDMLKGYNTNAIGIMDALNDVGFDVAGKRALVIGSGGAARAVLFILNWLRAEAVILAGRNDAAVSKLAKSFSCTPWSLDDLAEFPINVDIIVNATSVYIADETDPLVNIVGRLAPVNTPLMFDLNYGHRESIWQTMAARCGLPFMDGLSTLAYQARRTFLLWTGQELPKEEFLNILSTNTSPG